MKAITKRTWNLIDGDTLNLGRPVEIAVGTYDLECIPNPMGHGGNWLVISGTKIGMAESAWKQWQDDTFDEFQIVIEG